ncbi:unnamed protein product [Caretta caretta]
MLFANHSNNTSCKKTTTTTKWRRTDSLGRRTPGLSCHSNNKDCSHRLTAHSVQDFKQHLRGNPQEIQ